MKYLHLFFIYSAIKKKHDQHISNAIQVIWSKPSCLCKFKKLYLQMVKIKIDMIILMIWYDDIDHTTAQLFLSPTLADQLLFFSSYKSYNNNNQLCNAVTGRSPTTSMSALSNLRDHTMLDPGREEAIERLKVTPSIYSHGNVHTLINHETPGDTVDMNIVLFDYKGNRENYCWTERDLGRETSENGGHSNGKVSFTRQQMI